VAAGPVNAPNVTQPQFDQVPDRGSVAFGADRAGPGRDAR